MFTLSQFWRCFLGVRMVWIFFVLEDEMKCFVFLTKWQYRLNIYCIHLECYSNTGADKQILILRPRAQSCGNTATKWQNYASAIILNCIEHTK